MGNALGDLISKGEGHYNSYNRGTLHGKILPANQGIDFAQVSVAEIQRRQALPISDPDRIFAVGKYQIIPQTMTETVVGLRLDTSKNFTPDLQEFMFADYLIRQKRPAIYAYIVGKEGATLHAAQKAASLEWASVEDPDTPGHANYRYERQGNRMHTTAAQIAEALETMRDEYKLSIASGMPPDEAWRNTTVGEIGAAQWRGVPHAVPKNLDTIRNLQQTLNKLGLTDDQGRPLVPDGKHGPRTQQAIESFQRKYGMPVDGKASPLLLAATQIAVSVTESLRTAQQFGQQYGAQPSVARDWSGIPHAAPAQPPTRHPDRTPAPRAQFADIRSRVESTESLSSRHAERTASAPPFTPPDLDRATVETLQHNLNRLGFTDARGRPLADDGRYGPNTREAVAAFQHEQGLPATGVADNATLGAIHAHVIVADLQQRKAEREAEQRFQTQAQAYDARQAAPPAPSHHDPLGRDTATLHAAQPHAAGMDTLRGTYAPPFVPEVTRSAQVPPPGRAADAIDHTSPGQPPTAPPREAATPPPAADWTRHDPRVINAQHYTALKTRFPQFSEEQLTAYTAAIRKAGIPPNEPLYDVRLWKNGLLDIATAKVQYPNLTLDTNVPVPSIPESAQAVMAHDQQNQAEREQQQQRQSQSYGRSM